MNSSCQACVDACKRAKASGHRDWCEHACYDCAGVNLDEYFASIGYAPDEAAFARELAKMNAGHAQRAMAAPVQLSLFGEAA